ncbi:hypothetical protein ACWEGE_19130 [Amycolatopsis sp. NPDC004747]
MAVDLGIGVAGVILLVTGGFLSWKPRNGRHQAAAVLMTGLGSMLMAQFLIAPFVHGEWLASVLLGVMVAGIFAAAVIGGRRRHSSGNLAEGTKSSTNARNVGANGNSDSSSTSNHVTDDGSPG